jgi:signal transduction histidine kinase
MGRVQRLRSPRVQYLRDAIVAQWSVLFIVGAMAVAVLTLLWVGNHAFVAWRRSAVMLAERRTEQKVTLLGIALDRDMKAVQATVLARFGERRLGFRHPNDLFDIVVSAFSQFPYTESMFVWRVEPQAPDGRLYVFNRVDRPPAWARGLDDASPFPVSVIADPDSLMAMVRAIRASDTREQFLLNELTVAGRRYQVVASLFFDRTGNRPLVGAVGFLADLTWIREHYFGDLMKQVGTVVGESDVEFSILDEHRQVVATYGTAGEGDISFERPFPLAFFDRSLLAAQSKLETIPHWMIRVKSTAGADSTMRPWGALWALMAVTAIASLISIVLIGLSIRTMARHAAVRSEFVATVTHDLKTPLALVRAVGETLEQGRYTAHTKIDEYGRLLRLEAARLALRIDNLLAYARVSEPGYVYRAEVVDLLDVIHESLHRAEPRLLDFDVDANLSDAPLVMGDHAALLQVFDNLIDNAIKYSREAKSLTIRTAAHGVTAIVSIADTGTGIPPAELAHVFDKFFRGSHAHSGSGLGLAIAQRIVQAHRGTIEIVSVLGAGTTVTVKLPSSSPA